MKILVKGYEECFGDVYYELKCGNKEWIDTVDGKKVKPRHSEWDILEQRSTDEGYHKLKCKKCGKEVLTQYELYHAPTPIRYEEKNI